MSYHPSLNPALLAQGSINPAQLMNSNSNNNAAANLFQEQFNQMSPQQKAMYAAQREQARQLKMREQQQAAQLRILQQHAAMGDTAVNMSMNLGMGMSGMGMGMGGMQQQQQQFRDQSLQGYASPQMNMNPMSMNPMSMSNMTAPPMAPSLSGGSTSSQGGGGGGPQPGPMYPPEMGLARSSSVAPPMFDRPMSSSGQSGMMLPPSNIPRGMGMQPGMGNVNVNVGGGGIPTNMGSGMNPMNMNMAPNNMPGMGINPNSMSMPMSNPSPNPMSMNPSSMPMSMAMSRPGPGPGPGPSPGVGVGGIGPMRPPSRAMSSTPVNGGPASAAMNGRGMSPSQGQGHMLPPSGIARPQSRQQAYMGPHQGQGQGHPSQQQQHSTPSRSTPTPAPPTPSPHPHPHPHAQQQQQQQQQPHVAPQPHQQLPQSQGPPPPPHLNAHPPRSTPTPVSASAGSPPPPVSAPPLSGGSSSSAGAGTVPGSPYMGGNRALKRKVPGSSTSPAPDPRMQGQGQGMQQGMQGQGQGQGRPGSGMGMGMGMPGMGMPGMGMPGMGMGMGVQQGHPLAPPQGQGQGQGHQRAGSVGLQQQQQQQQFHQQQQQQHQQQQQQQMGTGRESVPPPIHTPLSAGLGIGIGHGGVKLEDEGGEVGAGKFGIGIGIGIGHSQSQSQGRGTSLQPTSVGLGDGGLGSATGAATATATSIAAVANAAGVTPTAAPSSATPTTTTISTTTPTAPTTSSTTSTTTSTTSPNQNPNPNPISLPPLPAHITSLLSPSTTRIQVVPLSSSTRTIPLLTESEIEDVRNWKERDREYEGVFRGMKERMGGRGEGGFVSGLSLGGGVGVGGGNGMNKDAGRAKGWWERGFVVPGYVPPGGVGGVDVQGQLQQGQQGQQGQGQVGPFGGGVSRWSALRKLGGPAVRDMFEVRYPRRGKDRSGRRGRREGVRVPSKIDIRDSNKPEILVPIRLEFDVEHHKMRDTFVWNLNDPIITPEIFAQTVVEDYAISSNYVGVIAKNIHDQLNDFRAHLGVGVVPLIEDGNPNPNQVQPDSTSNHNELSVPVPVSVTTTTGTGAGGGIDVVVDELELELESEGVPTRGRFVNGKDVGVGVGVVGKVNGDDGEGDVEEQQQQQQQDDEDDEEKWWKAWRGCVLGRGKMKGGRRRTPRPPRKRRRRMIEGDAEGDRDEDGGVDGDVEEEDRDAGDGEVWGWGQAKRLDEMEVDEGKTKEEMRILVRLDIIVGTMKLEDQFEWDIENEQITPEDFAEVYVQDLGLNGEFKTAISHSIREQIQTYQKSLFLVGHPNDGSAIQDEDLRMAFLPSLISAARPSDQVSSFTPLLNYLSDGELDRNEKEREKDMNKRRKRNTRGRRGIALPDREPIRTYRTPAIGFPELDPATLALAAAANAPVSRRAAAAAASLTIANMVASENGTAFLPQVAVPASQVTAQQAQKDNSKKGSSAKGHFKAPSFPSEVLRPRANVAAPTPSTAADVSKLPAPLENDPPPPALASVVATIGTAGSLDGRGGPRVISARRAKELEREAKEKEFADGQHPNMINGVWHCSNCGCPDNIAVGRRKGPLGDKSQCGICGKYWHRHRRPRPVEYNPDPEFHMGIKKELEQSKVNASVKKKGGAAALRAQSSTHTNTPAETSEAQTPARSNGDFDVSARQSPTPADDRAVSPVSTSSSASESPLAQRVSRTNGVRRISSPPASSETTKLEQTSPTKMPLGKDGKPITLSPTTTFRGVEPPQWLSAAKAVMMTKYPSDRFETILRKVNANSAPEWRIKCLDCPGKLYTPGPGETLANYEVHLKNRQHRQRVNDRLNNEAES